MSTRYVFLDGNPPVLVNKIEAFGNHSLLSKPGDCVLLCEPHGFICYTCTQRAKHIMWGCTDPICWNGRNRIGYRPDTTDSHLIQFPRPCYYLFSRHNRNSFKRVSRCLRFEKKRALVLDLLSVVVQVSWVETRIEKAGIPTLSSPVSWWCDVHSLRAPLHQLGVFQTLKLALHVCVVFWTRAKSKRCTVERRGQNQSAANLMILSTKYLQQMHRK